MNSLTSRQIAQQLIRKLKDKPETVSALDLIEEHIVFAQMEALRELADYNADS